MLDRLELRSDDHVGMVGCFSPLVEPIRRRVEGLSVFERGARVAPGLLTERRAAEPLPECSVALITATTLLNGTIDTLLVASANCREVVLLGPSTPLVPEVFAKSPRRASLTSGVVVTDADELFRTVARGGGTRDFRTSVAKVEWHADELFPRVGFIVTNLTGWSRKVVRFYNGRGTAEQGIKEGKYAIKWTRLSCHDFKDNQVRRQLLALVYNLDNVMQSLRVDEGKRSGLRGNVEEARLREPTE